MNDLLFKVRASGAGQIMTDSRKKDSLSETCKSYIRRQFIRDVYGREKDILTKAMSKGLHNEEQGITMLSIKVGEMLVKNQEHRENEYCKGTSDIVTDDCIFDLKCSYDIFTYAEASVTKDYWWQLQCYMDLWGIKKASLVYVLTDAPQHIIDAEVRLATLKAGPEADLESLEKSVIHKLTYPDIAESSKIKIFDIEYDPQAMEQLKERVSECRDFYENLTL